MATVTDIIQVRAQAKYVHSSARKARLVLDTIRGLSVPQARRALTFSTRAISTDIARVLHSAVSNAESLHAIDGEDLVVAAVFADEGPTLKRSRPRARGRVNRINKRSCHITLVVQQGTRPGGHRRAVEAAVEAIEPQAETKPKRRSPAKKKEAVA